MQGRCPKFFLWSFYVAESDEIGVLGPDLGLESFVLVNIAAEAQLFRSVILFIKFRKFQNIRSSF